MLVKQNVVGADILPLKRNRMVWFVTLLIVVSCHQRAHVMKSATEKLDALKLGQDGMPRFMK